MKVLSWGSGFPGWGFGKETGSPQGIWLWRAVGFDYRDFTGLGEAETPLLEGTKKNLVCTKTQGKGDQWPYKRLNQTYLLELECLQHWHTQHTHTHTHTHTHRVDVWVRSHSLWGRRHWQQQSWKGPLAWALLEVTINPIIEPIHPRVGSPLVKKLHSSVDNWIAVLVSIALLTRARPNFPHH